MTQVIAFPEVMEKLMGVIEQQADKITVLEKKVKLLDAWMSYGECTCLSCEDKDSCE